MTLAVSVLVLLAQLASPPVADGVPLSIEVVAGPDGPLFSVSGANVPVDRVVREIATRTGREVEGFDGVSRAALVTVDMIRRPPVEVVHVALGSVGLRAEWRAGVVRVIEDSTDGLDATRLRELATAGYASALQRFPDHPLGAAARLGQGEIEVQRGRPEAALEHFHALIDTYRSSPLVHQARLAAADVMERGGRYIEAAEHLRQVAGAAGAAPWHAESRLALARVTLALGNPELAEAMIATLERTHPSADRSVNGRRELLRAEAFLALGRWVPALHAVERAAVRGLPLDLEIDAMSVRARAFEKLDLLREASRAWLIVAVYGGDPGRAVAFQRAAELALECGEEMSALFITEQAAERGIELRALVSAARLRLGLPPPDGPVSLEELLAFAEVLAAAERHEENASTLGRIHAGRGSLSKEDFVRLAKLRAENTYALAGISAALDVLRDARWELDRAEDRAPLDRSAAELLERQRSFDRAMLAYEGVY